MLSEKQLEVVRNRANADLDLPLIGEDTEARLIDKVIEKLAPQLEPAMRAICPKPYVDCLKIALTEGIPMSDRRQRITEIMQGELSDPLARELNENVDADLVPERLEGKLMKVLTNKLIEEFVEWTVGEIDEGLESSLISSREAVANVQR